MGPNESAREDLMKHQPKIAWSLWQRLIDSSKVLPDNHIWYSFGTSSFESYMIHEKGSFNMEVAEEKDKWEDRYIGHYWMLVNCEKLHMILISTSLVMLICHNQFQILLDQIMIMACIEAIDIYLKGRSKYEAQIHDIFICNCTITPDNFLEKANCLEVIKMVVQITLLFIYEPLCTVQKSLAVFYLYTNLLLPRFLFG